MATLCNTARIEVHTYTSRLSIAQVGMFADKIETLRERVDLVVERAVRELLKLRLPVLAPEGVLRQPNSAAIYCMDVSEKSADL